MIGTAVNEFSLFPQTAATLATTVDVGTMWGLGTGLKLRPNVITYHKNYCEYLLIQRVRVLKRAIAEIDWLDCGIKPTNLYFKNISVSNSIFQAI